MMLRWTILLFATSVVFEKCNCKKEGCLDTSYSFEIYVKASPDMDSVSINDTIWFEVNESTHLMDLSGGRVTNFDQASNLGSSVGLDELLGNAQRRDAVSDFHYVLISGVETNSTNPARFKEYLYREESGRYVFKLGVVPKKPGIFRVGFSDAANVFRKNDGCAKAFFKIYFKATNQHLYFNDQNFGITTPLPSNIYCFKVK